MAADRIGTQALAIDRQERADGQTGRSIEFECDPPRSTPLQNTPGHEIRDAPDLRFAISSSSRTARPVMLRRQTRTPSFRHERPPSPPIHRVWPPMRYVYIKNGDAVAQTRRIVAAGRHHRHSGPDAYIGSFLAAHVLDEVAVLCRSAPRDRFAADRVVAESCPSPSWAGRFPGRIIAALHLAARTLSLRPDRILCSCDREALWVSVIVARLRRTPIVASRHAGMPSRRGLRRLSWRLEAFFLRRCNGVICHGPYLIDSVRQAGVDTRRIAGFGVDMGDFAAVATRSGPVVPALLASFCGRFASRVMFVGRMLDNKGVMDLLLACSRLDRSYSDRVGLVYVGDGEHVARLRALAASLGMTDRVLILGPVPHHDLPAVMRLATIIATPTRPSIHEGWCKVVMEAFVVGVPVVAPAFAAFPYTVSHEHNGLLFEPGNIDALANAIDRVLADGELLRHLRQGARSSGERHLATQLCPFVAAVDAAFA